MSENLHASGNQPQQAVFRVQSYNKKMKYANKSYKNLEICIFFRTFAGEKSNCGNDWCI